MGQCEHGLYVCNLCDERNRREEAAIDLETRLAAIEARLREAEGLLGRWQSVHISDNTWAEHGEDYHLPQDTQAFLSTTPTPDAEYVTVRREDLDTFINASEGHPTYAWGLPLQRLKAALEDKP